MPEYFISNPKSEEYSHHITPNLGVHNINSIGNIKLI